MNSSIYTFWENYPSIYTSRSEEEIQAIQSEIQKENEKYEHVKEEHDKLQRQIKNILEKIHEFCLRMKVINFDN